MSSHTPHKTHHPSKISIQWGSAQLKQKPSEKRMIDPSKSRKSMYGRAPGTSILFQDKISKPERSSLFDDRTLPAKQKRHGVILGKSESKHSEKSVEVSRPSWNMNFNQTDDRIWRYESKRSTLEPKTRQSQNFALLNQRPKLKPSKFEVRQSQQYYEEDSCCHDIFYDSGNLRQLRKDYEQFMRKESINNKIDRTYMKLKELTAFRQNLQSESKFNKKVKQISQKSQLHQIKQKLQSVIDFGHERYLLPKLIQIRNNKLQKQEQEIFLKQLNKSPDNSQLSKQIKDLYQVETEYRSVSKQNQSPQKQKSNPYLMTMFSQKRDWIESSQRLLEYLKKCFKNEGELYCSKLLINNQLI